MPCLRGLAQDLQVTTSVSRSPREASREPLQRVKVLNIGLSNGDISVKMLYFVLGGKKIPTFLSSKCQTKTLTSARTVVLSEISIRPFPPA